MTRRNVRKQGWVFPFFSPDSNDRLSLNFHRFVILYTSCDTRSVGFGQHCLPKVSTGFKTSSNKWVLAPHLTLLLLFTGYVLSVETKDCCQQANISRCCRPTKNSRRITVSIFSSTSKQPNSFCLNFSPYSQYAMLYSLSLGGLWAALV